MLKPKNWVAAASLLGCLSSAAAWGQGLLESSYNGSRFHLLVPCHAKGMAVVYALQRPDRIVIELPDGISSRDLHVAGHGGPKVHVRELGLDRAQIVVEIDHRVPPSALKVRTTSAGIELDVNMVYEVEESFSLTPGVRWRRREWIRDGDYCLWNELLVNPRDAGVKLEVGLAHDRLDSREKPSSMCSRLGGLAAVNGGYFGGNGGPLGLVVKDGKILAPNVASRPPRTVLGLMNDGRIEFDQMVAKAGSLSSRSGTNWDGVRMAIGAGPRLIHRGKIALTTEEEELGPRGNDITRKAARTAVATMKDGKFLIVTAVGYNNLHRQGIRLDDLSEELVKRGAAEAMNLDGGSSTSMSIGGNVISNGAGSPHVEKEVATALVVVDSRPFRYPTQIRATIDSTHLQADGESEATVTAQVCDSYGRALPDGTMVRVYPDRCLSKKDAYKMKDGQATITLQSVPSAGDAHVRLESATARQDLSFHLDPGPAEKITWRLTPGKVSDIDQEVAIVVHASDHWGNPVNVLPVSSLDDRGQPLESGATGKNGNKTFIVRVPLRGGKVTLQIAGLGTRIVTIPAAMQAFPAAQPVRIQLHPNDPSPETTPTPDP